MEELFLIAGDWLQENIWLIESTTTVCVTVFAVFAWKILCHKIAQKSRQTKTPLDEIIVNALNTPVLFLIIVLGIIHLTSVLSIFLRKIYPDIGALFNTLRQLVFLLVVFWALFRAIYGLENHYSRQTIKVGTKEFLPGTMHAIFQTLRAALLFIIALTAMDTFGISVSGLLAVGGFGSILLGFAAKDTLTNFFSGLLIFMEQPFVVGDWIRHPSSNIEGVVERIGWRTTQIRTFDARPLYVPNSLFFNNVVENPQRMSNRRIYEYIGLRYEDMPRLPAVLSDIRQMLNEHPDIAQDKIKMVNFDRYGAYSLDCFIYVMTKTIDWAEYHRAKEDVLTKIADIVKHNGCDFAFPTRTVYNSNLDQLPSPPPPQ